MPVIVQDLPYPRINGKYYQFSSIRLRVAGETWYDFVSFNFEDGVERGYARGASRMKLGRTAGDYDATASFDIWTTKLEEFLNLVDPNREGHYDVEGFDVSLDFAEPNMPLQQVVLIGPIINKISDAHSQGTEPLKNTITLDIFGVTRNGRNPIRGINLGSGSAGAPLTEQSV